MKQILLVKFCGISLQYIYPHLNMPTVEDDRHRKLMHNPNKFRSQLLSDSFTTVA